MTDSPFESALDRMVRDYAEGGVRPVDSQTLAQTLVDSRRRRFGFIGPWRLAFSPTLIVVVMGLLLALVLAVFIGASLLHKSFEPRLGRNGVIAYTLGEVGPPSSFGLHLVNADGSGDHEVGVGSSAGQFSADGTLLWYSSGFGVGPAQLVLARADGANAREIAATHQLGYAMSPDGSKMLTPFSDSTGFSGELAIIATSDGQVDSRIAAPADFPAAMFEVVNGAWSPDGKTVAVSVNRSFEGDIYGPYRTSIYLIDVVTGELSLLTSRMSTSTSLSWSPDGQQLAYGGWPDGTPGPQASYDLIQRQEHIFTIRADGTDETDVTGESVGDGNPQWAPDGNAISYVHWGDTAPLVMVVDLTGGQPTPPRVGPVGSLIAWSPDGTTLLTSNSGMSHVVGQPAQPYGQRWGTIQTIDRSLLGPPRTILTANDVITSLSWQWLEP